MPHKVESIEYQKTTKQLLCNMVEINGITYGIAETDECLRQILELQERNLAKNISQEEFHKEGFVTVKHTFDLLKRMNEPYGHIVARHNDKIIGYTLVLLRDLGHEIALLNTMFERINTTPMPFSDNQQKNLGESKYFVIGQVCIDKDYRGQGIFPGLYAEMKRRMAPHFEWIFSLVSRRNPRSLRAHAKVGFQTFVDYEQGSEHWELIGWQIS